MVCTGVTDPATPVLHTTFPTALMLLLTSAVFVCPTPPCCHYLPLHNPQNAPAVRENGLLEGNQWRYSICAVHNLPSVPSH